MNVQTSENRSRDSRISVGVGIDCVRKEWQNSVSVPAAFLKTGSFPGNYLRSGVKTSWPPILAGIEGRTTEHGGLNG